MMNSDSDESDNNLEHEEFEAANIPALLPLNEDGNEFVIEGLNIGEFAQPDLVFVDSDDEIDDQAESNSEDNADNEQNYSSGDDVSGENGEENEGANGERSPAPNFDAQLPTRHIYLGDGMEPLAGRSVYDEDTTLEVPLVVLDILLVPGQTLPLSEFHFNRISALRRCVHGDRMFGTVKNPFEGVSLSLMTGGINVASKGTVGTLAEIYEYSEEDEEAATNRLGGLYVPPTFSIKAKGRQRFQIVSVRRQADGNLMATIKIRPEKKMRHPLTHVESHATARFISPIPAIGSTVSHPLISQIPNDENQTGDVQKNATTPEFERVPNVPIKRKRNYYSAMTQWPSFVYDAYDEVILVQKIHKKIKEQFQEKLVKNIPFDPSELSFWIAQNLTLGNTSKEKILKIDSPIQRLVYQLDLLDRVDRRINCIKCGMTIADQQDVFCMSVEGPQGTYVNPGGFVHETLTVSKAQELTTQGRQYSTESSWFPGYSWKIVICARCHLHLGWKFRAVERLNPPKFYGLTRRSVVFK